MYRCIELAKLGAGYVAPNPMVGAVLVYEDQVIGEGYHQKYGEAHAEVNCINSVKKKDRDRIGKSTMYVSLEPCSHFGKTPPCTNLIIRNKIPEVVIGCRDPFKEVNGKGIEKLKTAGVKVQYEILEENCRELNKRFFTFHKRHRPYIILKWAETADGKIAASSRDRLFISNENCNRLVHRWRSEEAAILVGTNTVLLDNPELTTRLWNGHSPVRLVVDMDLKLSDSMKVFNKKQRTIIFNSKRHEEGSDIGYYQITEDVSLIQQIANALYRMNIQSVIVEGGARLLQSFIDEDIWDETRIIKNETLTIDNGLPGPVLANTVCTEEMKIGNDKIRFYKNEIMNL